jgi:hypothetical protein
MLVHRKPSPTGSVTNVSVNSYKNYKNYNSRKIDSCVFSPPKKSNAPRPLTKPIIPRNTSIKRI